MENKIDILKNFIHKNRISFYEGHRNAPAVKLSGFALFIGYSYSSELSTDFDKVAPKKLDVADFSELDRVFKYAKDNHYERYWEREDISEYLPTEETK